MFRLICGHNKTYLLAIVVKNNAYVSMLSWKVQALGDPDEKSWINSVIYHPSMSLLAASIIY